MLDLSGKIFARGLSLYRPSVARFVRKTEGKYFPGQIEQTRLLRYLLHGFSFWSVKEKKRAHALARSWSDNFPVLYGKLLDRFSANQRAGFGYWHWKFDLPCNKVYISISNSNVLNKFGLTQQSYNLKDLQTSQPLSTIKLEILLKNCRLGKCLETSVAGSYFYTRSFSTSDHVIQTSRHLLKQNLAA